MIDKGKILWITGRYHITHKMELLLFFSKTYCVSLGQRKESAANPGREAPIRDLCKPKLFGFKLFSLFNKRDAFFRHSILKEMVSLVIRGLGTGLLNGLSFFVSAFQVSMQNFPLK